MTPDPYRFAMELGLECHWQKIRFKGEYRWTRLYREPPSFREVMRCLSRT